MVGKSQVQRDKKCDAYIISHRNEQNALEYLVRPAVVVIDGSSGAAEFTIRNVTGDPNVEIDLRGRAHQVNRRRVGPGKGEFETFTIGTDEFSFAYAVTVSGVPAKGESDPVIIIDPPCP